MWLSALALVSQGMGVNPAPTTRELYDLVQLLSLLCASISIFGNEMIIIQSLEGYHED